MTTNPVQNRPSTGPLSGEFLDAVEFANSIHGKQFRKGTNTPYIGHLLDVAATVINAGGDEEHAVAALLHDAVEDQGGQKTLDRIKDRFGYRVSQIVEACSDSIGEPKPPWRQRKEAYIAHLESADRDVRLVAAADKLSNARALLSDLKTTGENVWTRFNAPKEDQLWYYCSVVFALEDAPPDPKVSRILTELKDVIRQIQHVSGGPDVQELLDEAAFHAKASDYRTAIQFARMALTDASESAQAADAIELIEDCRKRQEQARGALVEVEEDAADHPDDAEKAFRRGLTLSRTGDIEGSTAAYKSALMLGEPMCVASLRDCLNNIGWNYFRCGDYPESLQWFKRSLGVTDPEDPKPYPLAMENMILANARLGRARAVEELVREYVTRIGRLPRYETMAARSVGLDPDSMFIDSVRAGNGL